MAGALPTILVVDDNALVAQLVEQQLEGDYHVLSAPNGKIGVDVARARRPDLVLMDLAMPVMDGRTAIRILRADAATAAIPIVVLSATADGNELSRALASGADTFVAKPIDEKILRQLIARLLVKSGSVGREASEAKPASGGHARPELPPVKKADS